MKGSTKLWIALVIWVYALCGYVSLRDGHLSNADDTPMEIVCTVFFITMNTIVVLGICSLFIDMVVPWIIKVADKYLGDEYDQ